MFLILGVRHAHAQGDDLLGGLTGGSRGSWGDDINISHAHVDVLRVRVRGLTSMSMVRGRIFSGNGQWLQHTIMLRVT